MKGLLAHKLRLALTAAGHRARGHLHLGDPRPDRHPARHLHHALRAASTRTSTSRCGARPPSPTTPAAAAPSASPSPSRSLPTVRQVPGVAYADGHRERATPSSWPPTGRPSPPGAPPPSASSFDPNTAALGPAGDQRHGPDRRRPGGHGRRHRQQVPLPRRRPGPRPPHRAAADLHHLRHRDLRHRPTTWPGPPWPPSTCPPPRSVLGQPGQYSTPSTSWPSPASNKAEVQRSIAAVLPAGVEVVTGQTVANEADQLDQPGPLLLLHRPAGLRLHLPVRGRLHHLQHLLHHRGPAHPGAGPAADRGRQPSPGVPLGPGRGPAHRGWWPPWSAWAWASSPRWARGPAQGVRHHASPPAPWCSPPGRWSPPSSSAWASRWCRPSARPAGPCGSHRWPPWPTTAATRPSRPGAGSSSGSVVAVLGIAALVVGPDQAGHPAGRGRSGGHLPRHRDAGPGGGPAHGQCHRPPPGPAARASPAGWAVRTPCAAPGGRPRRRRPSWSAWPWSPPSPSSGPRCPSRPPAVSTRR